MPNDEWSGAKVRLFGKLDAVKAQFRRPRHIFLHIAHKHVVPLWRLFRVYALNHATQGIRHLPFNIQHLPFFVMSVPLDQFKQKAKTFGKRFLWVSLAILLLTGGGYFFWRTYTVSEGTRSGVLFKISKKGYVFKTFEGQLHQAGSVMMTPQSVWDFSAKDDAVYRELQQYEGKNVVLYYHQKVDAFPWQGDTDYIVYKVEAGR